VSKFNVCSYKNNTHTLFPSWDKAQKSYFRHYLRRVETPRAIAESMEAGTAEDLAYDYQIECEPSFEDDDDFDTFGDEAYCWRCVGVHCTCFDDPPEDVCDDCGQRYCECDLRDPRHFRYDYFDDCLP